VTSGHVRQSRLYDDACRFVRVKKHGTSLIPGNVNISDVLSCVNQASGIPRMNGDDTWIATEVGCVQRQEAIQPMHMHRGNQPGIMHLNTRHCAGQHQPPPVRMNLRSIRQEDKQPLDYPRSSIRFRHGQAETVDRFRSGADAPELNQILSRVTHFLAALLERMERRTDGIVLGVAALHEPQQDVGVGEIGHQPSL
jgi:hypothetical protein